MVLNQSDVAIIGAGPYGLSLAAHLDGAGVSYTVVGRPMDTWQSHMPKGMLLKSDGFASNLFDPLGEFPLSQFCRDNGVAYDDVRERVKLDTFVNYGLAFANRFVRNLSDESVISLKPADGGYTIQTKEGSRLHARRVVIAVGVGYFRNLPAQFAQLPLGLVSHSYDHHDLTPFANRRTAVIGGGASAIDTAALLHESKSEVLFVSRRAVLNFGVPPAAGQRSLLQRLRFPSSPLGQGYRSLLFTRGAPLFHRLPEAFRVRAVRRHLGPAAGWAMRERFVGRFPALTGHQVSSVAAVGDKVKLELRDPEGKSTTEFVDHLIAATGFRVDVRRLDFLDPTIVERLRHVDNTPVLSTQFESSVPNLYFVGPVAANSFGSLLRFAHGAGFVSRRLAPVLAGASRRRDSIDASAMNVASGKANLS